MLFSGVTFCHNTMDLSKEFYLKVWIILIYCQGILAGDNYQGSQHQPYLRGKRDLSGIRDFVSNVRNNDKVDVVFIMDRSAGVGQAKFYLSQHKLVRSLITHFLNIGPDHARIAVITFGRDVTVVFDHISKDSKLKCNYVHDEDIWNNVRYLPESTHSYGTNISGALYTAAPILQSGRSRANTQVVVLLTDGEINKLETASLAATTLKRDWVQIYGVGLGNWLRDYNLKQLTSYPNYYAHEDDWKQLLPEFNTNIPSASYTAVGDEPEMQVLEEDLCGSCGSHGQCYCNQVSGYSQCQCDPGYTSTNGLCTACPSGQYKPDVGNGACTVCPGQVTTIGTASTNLQQCVCSEGSCYDPCDWLSCGNHQICVLTPDSGYSQGACRCSAGWTGQWCDVPEDNCHEDVCLNAGTCVNSINSYVCVCPWGYTGRRCEIEQDECVGVICGDRARCEDGINMFQCQCLPGYSGAYCADYDPSLTPPPPAVSTAAATSELDPNATEPSVAVHMASEGGLGKTLLISALPGGLGLLILIITVVTIAFVVRQRKQRSLSNMTDTTTPVPPSTMSGFDMDVEDAVYDNEPLQRGMDEWYAYTLDLIHSEVMTKVTISRLDGEKWVLSPGCVLSVTDIEAAYAILTKKLVQVRMTFQGHQYGVVSNEDFLLVAHSVGGATHGQEILCATKTRQFVIVCVAQFSGDNGLCKKETQKLRNHIKEQGL